MDPSPPLPPSAHGSQPPEPPAASATKWMLPIAIGVLVLVAILAALAVPFYESLRKRELSAKGIREQRPSLPLSPAQEEAAARFGDKLAQALTEGDIVFLAGAADVEAAADRMFAPLGRLDGSESRRGFVDAVRHKRGGLFNPLLGGQVKFLRVVSRDGFPAVRLRVTHSGEFVSYFDVLMRVSGTGTIKALDIFDFASGACLSDEGRGAAVLGQSAAQPNLLRAALRLPDLEEKTIGQLARMTTAARLGRVAEVCRQYDQLPLVLKNHRSFFLLYLRALESSPHAFAEGEKRYREAVARAPGILGPDAATELLQSDLQILDGDFAGAEQSLRKVEALVGPDAYLTHLRALMLLRHGKIAEAEALARQAAAAEPGLPNLADLRLLIHAARKDHAGLLAELRAIKAAHHRVLTRTQLAEEAFADFLKSPEFAEWEAENNR